MGIGSIVMARRFRRLNRAKQTMQQKSVPAVNGEECRLHQWSDDPVCGGKNLLDRRGGAFRRQNARSKGLSKTAFRQVSKKNVHSTSEVKNWRGKISYAAAERAPHTLLLCCCMRNLRWRGILRNFKKNQKKFVLRLDTIFQHEKFNVVCEDYFFNSSTR